MRLEAPRTRRRLISLTPLIDVVFILLVFFMLASSLIDWRVLELNAPASAGSDHTSVGAWLVRIRPDDLDLNAETMAAETLALRVASKIAVDPQQRILVEPRADVSLQRLIDILDLLRDAGASRLTLTSD